MRVRRFAIYSDEEAADAFSIDYLIKYGTGTWKEHVKYLRSFIEYEYNHTALYTIGDDLLPYLPKV